MLREADRPIAQPTRLMGLGMGRVGRRLFLRVPPCGRRPSCVTHPEGFCHFRAVRVGMLRAALGWGLRFLLRGSGYNKSRKKEDARLTLSQVGVFR